jgi:hypothetical protein
MDSGSVGQLALGDCRVEHGRNAPNPSVIGAQIRGIGDGVRIDQEIRQLGADRPQVGIERRRVATILEVELLPLELGFPDVIVCLACG